MCKVDSIYVHVTAKSFEHEIDLTELVGKLTMEVGIKRVFDVASRSRIVAA